MGFLSFFGPFTVGLSFTFFPLRLVLHFVQELTSSELYKDHFLHVSKRSNGFYDSAGDGIDLGCVKTFRAGQCKVFFYK